MVCLLSFDVQTDTINSSMCSLLWETLPSQYWYMHATKIPMIHWLDTFYPCKIKRDLLLTNLWHSDLSTCNCEQCLSFYSLSAINATKHWGHVWMHPSSMKNSWFSMAQGETMFGWVRGLMESRTIRPFLSVTSVNFFLRGWAKTCPKWTILVMIINIRKYTVQTIGVSAHANLTQFSLFRHLHSSFNIRSHSGGSCLCIFGC